MSRALDLFFPRRCELCSRRMTRPEEDLTCDPCGPHVEWIRGATCPKCGAEVTEEGEDRCRECAGRSFGFKAAVAAGKYAGFVRELVHRFKFDGRMDLAKPLAARIAAQLRATSWAEGIQVIVPVPMRRLKILFERRYNPAELLASRLSRELNRPKVLALSQVRSTVSQTKLTGAERLKNPAGAFAVRRAKKIDGKQVLLVDDVLTTGATASECAKALKDAGAARVYLAVIGR
jgi:ComF family protein